MFRSCKPVFEEIKPSYTGWSEEPTYQYYLYLDLPGFKKEEINVQYEDSGYVKINGRRRENDKKFICFDQKIKVPENADVNKTKANLADGILTITVPMKETERKNPKKDKKEDIIDRAEVKNEMKEDDKKICYSEQKIYFSEQIIRKWEQESTETRSALEKIKENREIVIAAAVAISQGVLLSLKFASSRK